MPACANDVMDFLASLSSNGRIGDEEGLLYGYHDRPADAVLVTWMPTVAAVRHAIEEGCGLIVSHEPLCFFDYFAAQPGRPWTADRARLTLLAGADIAIVRAHSTIDPTHIVPAFIKAVGLSQPQQVGGVWSFHEEPPIRLRDPAKAAASGLGMQAVRVTGEPDREVTRVGTMVGGLGQDRHLASWERFLMGLGVEAILVGETNDFAQRFAVDCGIGLIETCHSASEEPGLAVFADDLRARLDGARVVFHKEAVPWTTVAR